MGTGTVESIEKRVLGIPLVYLKSYDLLFGFNILLGYLVQLWFIGDLLKGFPVMGASS